MLGYKGFVIIMDEMEKWQNLTKDGQTKASNFIGGLIWAATSPIGHRMCRKHEDDPRWFGNCDHLSDLDHSRLHGGFPFTTKDRCYIGLAIAMTPREYDVSDQVWSQHGPIIRATVPALSERKLAEYCGHVVPLFAEAYGVGEPKPDELKHIAAEALGIWRTHGELNTRYGVQAAIAAFDHWRDRH
jgi:hypothetical protein